MPFTASPQNIPLIVAQFRAMGYNDAQISAALAAGKVESQFDPRAVGPAGELGTWQWNGPRKEGLLTYAGENGLDPYSPETQAKFFDHEMRSTEKYAGNQFFAADDPTEAAMAMLHFERPAGYTRADPTNSVAYDQRVKGASEMMAELNGDALPGAEEYTPVAPAASEDDAPTATPEKKKLAGLLGDDATDFEQIWASYNALSDQLAAPEPVAVDESQIHRGQFSPLRYSGLLGR